MDFKYKYGSIAHKVERLEKDFQDILDKPYEKQTKWERELIKNEPIYIGSDICVGVIEVEKEVFVLCHGKKAEEKLERSRKRNLL